MLVKKLLHGFSQMTLFPTRRLTLKERRHVLWKGLVVSIVGIFFASLIVISICGICGASGYPISNMLSSKIFSSIINTHRLLVLFLFCVVCPIIEECSFRLWLSFKREHLFISLFFLFYILLNICIPSEKQIFQYEVIPLRWLFGYVYRFLIALLLSSSIFLVSQKNLDRIKEEYGHDLVVLSVIVFSALHITNMNFVWILLPAALLCCLPQLISGLVMTYYRINLGFFYGLVLHVLWNFVSII